MATGAPVAGHYGMTFAPGLSRGAAAVVCAHLPVDGSNERVI